MVRYLLKSSILFREISRIPFAGCLSRLAGTGNSSTSRPFKTSCANKHDINFKIKKYTDSFEKLSHDLAATVAGSNISLDDLEFELANRKVNFNLTWLRDSCHCSRCTHKHSRQRLFTPKDFRKSLFGVDQIEITHNIPNDDQFSLLPGNCKEGFLHVHWNDGHESFYSLDWLNNIASMFRKTGLNLQSHQRSKFDLPPDDFYAPSKKFETNPEFWTVAKINKLLTPIDYNALIDKFEFHDEDPTHINTNDLSRMSVDRYNSLVELTNQLTKLGVAKIINVPSERNQILRVARSMAYERPTGYGIVFDVVVEPSEEINLAYSSQEFDLHSDLTYREKSPGVQLLHCLRNSDEGGASYFSDAFNAACELKQKNPILFEVLLQFPAIFVVKDPYRAIKFRRQKPILTLNYRGDLQEVYYSPFMLAPVGYIEDVKLFYLAMDKYTQLLQSEENKLITKMHPGDLFIFNNRRVLHGRSSYTSLKSNRFLQGCYMDWDEIGCLYEKLLTKR